MSSIDERLRPFQQRMRLVPAWLRILLVVPPLAAAVYWALTNSGPYEWLITHVTGQRTSDPFGNSYRYHPIFTFGVLTVLLLLPSFAILNWLSRRYQSKRG
jgi:hypothetical protein